MFINEKTNIKSAAKNKSGGAMRSVMLRKGTNNPANDNSSPATIYFPKIIPLRLPINQNVLAENAIAAKRIERTVCIGDI